MTLQIVNSTTAGATQDLSSRVFMASERLGLPPFSLTQNAEEGSVAHSTLAVDDPSGNLTLTGHRRIYFLETAAPANEQIIGNAYIGVKEISRGDWNVGPLARAFSVQLADANTLISRRIVVGADGNRPAETDVQRVQWLLTTTEANEFNGSNAYVSTAGAVSMDAVDYRGQSVEQILNDCSQASGKNFWVIYEEALGEFSLWYDKENSTAYSSTLRLSNDEADVDDSTTFAYFHTSTLTQDPSRVYSSTYLPYGENSDWVYETRLATGNTFVFRDVAYPSFNVKSETKARARATRYNADAATEDHVAHVSFVVPAAKVNGLMHGHRIEAKGTHWPDYTAYTWMRCLQRTVTQLSSTHYRIDADLSPIVVPAEVTPNAYMCGAYSAEVPTTTQIFWEQAGSACAYPPVTGVTMLGAAPAWQGWEFSLAGEITFQAVGRVVPAAAGGVMEARKNNVVFATATWVAGNDYATITTTVSVSPGDQIKFWYQPPSGLSRGLTNNAATGPTYIASGTLA